MARTAATITVDNKPAPDLLGASIELAVETDFRLASSFRLRLATHRESDGTWVFLDDDRLKLWNPVAISASIDDDEKQLFLGYITQISMHLDPDQDSSYVEVTGMDASCLMSLEEKIKAWPNKSDSDIAREIFSNYRLTATVDDTGVVHADTAATIIQRDTDIQFLKRLARRNGFECCVRGSTGFFRKPVLSAPAQQVMAAHFGQDTNLGIIDARVNALRPMRVEMHQIDAIGKQLQAASADAGAQKQLGRDAAFSFTVPQGVQSKMFVKQEVAVNQQEMQNLCRALFDEAEWFAQASGELDTATYGGILETMQPVPVKGAGEMFSGVYYVTNVKHLFDIKGYTQQFTARRNALAPTPSDFSAMSSLCPQPTAGV
jgi:phage protein D